MTRTRWGGFAAATVCLSVMVCAGWAADVPPDADKSAKPLAPTNEASRVPGRITVGGSFGDDVQLYQLDAMFPVLRSQSAMLLLNPRGVLLKDEEQELSVGFVGRQLLDRPSVILGVNAYYDARESEADNLFHQVGGGVEMLSRWVDARANYYHPLTDAETLDTGERGVSGVAGGWRRVEEALQGFDAEVGVWLPYVSRVVPSAVYAGYYAFDSDAGLEDVDGFKARLECRLHPSITLDAEWYDEKEYAGSDYFVGVRLHLPLDFWNGIRMPRAGGSANPLAARMTDPVHRDARVRMVESTQHTAPVPVPQKKADRADKPDCFSYPSLDEEGEVIYVTICE